MDATSAANQPLKFRIECISIESDFIESYLTLVLTTEDASLYFREGNAVRIPLVHGEFYRTYPAIENKFRSKGYRLKACGSCSSFVLRPFSATRETGYCSSSVGSRRGDGVHLLDSCDDFEFRVPRACCPGASPLHADPDGKNSESQGTAGIAETRCTQSAGSPPEPSMGHRPSMFQVFGCVKALRLRLMRMPPMRSASPGHAV